MDLAEHVKTAKAVYDADPEATLAAVEEATGLSHADAVRLVDEYTPDGEHHGPGLGGPWVEPVEVAAPAPEDD